MNSHTRVNVQRQFFNRRIGYWERREKLPFCRQVIPGQTVCQRRFRPKNTTSVELPRRP